MDVRKATFKDVSETRPEPSYHPIVSLHFRDPFGKMTYQALLTDLSGRRLLLTLPHASSPEDPVEGIIDFFLTAVKSKSADVDELVSDYRIQIQTNREEDLV